MSSVAVHRHRHRAHVVRRRPCRARPSSGRRADSPSIDRMARSAQRIVVVRLARRPRPRARCARAWSAPRRRRCRRCAWRRSRGRSARGPRDCARSLAHDVERAGGGRRVGLDVLLEPGHVDAASCSSGRRRSATTRRRGPTTPGRSPRGRAPSRPSCCSRTRPGRPRRCLPRLQRRSPAHLCERMDSGSAPGARPQVAGNLARLHGKDDGPNLDAARAVTTFWEVDPPAPAPPSPRAGAGRAVVIPIEGMTCASCVDRVGRALRKAPGVRDAEVNLALRQARVVLDDSDSLEPVLEAIEDAGYHATASAEALRSGLAAEEAEGAEAPKQRAPAAGPPRPSPGVRDDGAADGAWHPGPRPSAGCCWRSRSPWWRGRAGLSSSAAGQPLRHRTADMNTLVAIGSGTAFVFSTVATAAPGSSRATASPPTSTSSRSPSSSPWSCSARRSRAVRARGRRRPSARSSGWPRHRARGREGTRDRARRREVCEGDLGLGATGRTSAGRRARDRGRVGRRRVDADGRAHAGRQGPGRPGRGGHHQRTAR